jgi:hypothetical protein
MVKTNDRARRRFANLIAPDVRIEAVVLLKRLKGPNTAKRSNVLALYTDRYGLTNTLGSHSMLGDQWLEPFSLVRQAWRRDRLAHRPM